jgi:hypothetical protein
VDVTWAFGSYKLEQRASVLTLNADLLDADGETKIYISDNDNEDITGDTLLNEPINNCYG